MKFAKKSVANSQKYESGSIFDQETFVKNVCISSLGNQEKIAGTHEPNKLTCSQLSTGRALHRHRRGRGFEPCWSQLNFLGFYKRQLL